MRAGLSGFSPRRVALSAAALLATAAVALLAQRLLDPGEAPQALAAVAVAPPEAEPAPAEPQLTAQEIVLARNDALGVALRRAEVGEAESQAILAALARVLDFRRLRPGHTLRLYRDASGALARGELELAPFDVIDLEPAATGLLASKRELDLVTVPVRVAVTIGSSLFEAFVEAGEDPALAVAASEVLAWEMDFYRDVRRGDRLEMVVEKVEHEGRRVRYGHVLAVRYSGELGTKELYRHELAHRSGYFDPQGRSARRAFLKQPLPLVRITSGFGGRKHPVLGYFKKHEGVDYGAPTGTPVWAVGDGVVTFADTKGANGKLVTVRHSSGYTSHYAHLSKILVRPGMRVSQKQVIGLVGSTGRSTGPHLHFALSRDGKFVNPLGVRFPAGDPVPASEREAFAASLELLRAQLDGSGLVAAREH